MYDLNKCIKLFVKVTRIFLAAPFVFKDGEKISASSPLKWLSIITFTITTSTSISYFFNLSYKDFNGYKLVALLRILFIWVNVVVYQIQTIRQNKKILKAIRKIKEIDTLFKTEEKSYKKMYWIVIFCLIQCVIAFTIFLLSANTVKKVTDLKGVIFSIFTGISLQAVAVSDIYFLLLLILINFYWKKCHRELENLKFWPVSVMETQFQQKTFIK